MACPPMVIPLGTVIVEYGAVIGTALACVSAFKPDSLATFANTGTATIGRYHSSWVNSKAPEYTQMFRSSNLGERRRRFVASIQGSGPLM